MQIKRKLIEENGSMAVYTMITLLSFLIMLTGIYLSSVSVRKIQLKTVMKIKQSYELYNANAEDVYQIQLKKLNKQKLSD